MADTEGLTTIRYEIHVYDEDRREIDSFSKEEKVWLRPIAETLAMLDGNAFFGTDIGEREWYEQYLLEAWALFKGNGGIGGWSGEVSWIKGSGTDNPAVKAAWDEYVLVRNLARENK